MPKRANSIAQAKPKVIPTSIYRWIKPLIRLGFAAKGSLYGTMGLIAVLVLFQTNQEIVGIHGILVKIVAQPFGRLLIVFLIIGLSGYVLRRFIQAIFDPKYSGQLNLKRLIRRCGYLVSGLTYSGVIYTASQLLIGLEVENDDTIEDLAAELFERPFGLWVVVIGGILTIGVGLSYLYGAYNQSYIRELRSSLNPQLKTLATGIGQVGIATRGISFITTGIFLLEAGFMVQADPAGGLTNVLQQLESQPLGLVWLGAIAFGFIAYGIYMLIVALYGRDLI